MASLEDMADKINRLPYQTQNIGRSWDVNRHPHSSRRCNTAKNGYYNDDLRGEKRLKPGPATHRRLTSIGADDPARRDELPIQIRPNVCK